MKHSDGYSEHVKVACPDCGVILLQCLCEMKQPKTLYLRKCDQCLPSA